MNANPIFKHFSDRSYVTSANPICTAYQDKTFLFSFCKLNPQLEMQVDFSSSSRINMETKFIKMQQLQLG